MGPMAGLEAQLDQMPAATRAGEDCPFRTMVGPDDNHSVGSKVRREFASSGDVLNTPSELASSDAMVEELVKASQDGQI